MKKRKSKKCVISTWQSSFHNRLEDNLLERFDEILVLDHGTIVESGTFKVLLDRKGVFYSLYKGWKVGDILVMSPIFLSEDKNIVSFIDFWYYNSS